MNHEEKLWPYRIDNRSPVDVIVYQGVRLSWNVMNGSSHDSHLQFQRAKAKYKIPRGESMLYTWDEPALQEKYLVVNINGYEREVNIQEIGPLVPFYYPVRVIYI
jgi:vacuolar protein sorting-associated protein 13A/C